MKNRCCCCLSVSKNQRIKFVLCFLWRKTKSVFDSQKFPKMFLGCRYLMFVDALVCVNVVLWLDKICVGHITLEWYFVLYSLWTEAYRFYLSITNERELFFFRDEDLTNILCPTSFFIRRPKSNLFLFYLTDKVMIAKIMMITLMIISQWYCLKYSYQNYYM